VEYSDFECPFCGKWYREVYPLIKEKYIDTGKAILVFKQFPLTQTHSRAMPAAIASECAFRQGNDYFWKMHDKLFENQDALSDEDLKKYADEIGLESLQFDLCYSNLDTEPEVSTDFSEGTQSGVTGTPGFIIAEAKYPLRGELIVGAHPFEVFEEIIERI